MLCVCDVILTGFNMELYLKEMTALTLTSYDTTEEFNVDSKAENSLNLAHVATRNVNIRN